MNMKPVSTSDIRFSDNSNGQDKLPANTLLLSGASKVNVTASSSLMGSDSNEALANHSYQILSNLNVNDSKRERKYSQLIIVHKQKQEPSVVGQINAKAITLDLLSGKSVEAQNTAVTDIKNTYIDTIEVNGKLDRISALLASIEEVQLARQEGRLSFSLDGKSFVKSDELPKELQEAFNEAIDKHIQLSLVAMDPAKQEAKEKEEEDETTTKRAGVRADPHQGHKLSEGKGQDSKKEFDKLLMAKKNEIEQQIAEEFNENRRAVEKSAKKKDEEVHEKHMQLDKEQEKASFRKDELEKEKVLNLSSAAAACTKFMGAMKQDKVVQNLFTHKIEVIQEQVKQKRIRI